MYFTQVHEDAIVEFSSTDDLKVREELYVKTIQPVFSQMVDKIVFTYRFTSLPDIDDLRQECKVYLATILTKFDPLKALRLSLLLCDHKELVHSQSKEEQEKARARSLLEVAELDPEIHFVDKTESYQDSRMRKERIEKLREEMKTWEVDFDKEKEKRVYDAVQVLFDSVDDIEIFNKKAIYLYLREITGMSTKQIVTQLNKMRKRYREFQKDWDNGEI